MLSTLEQTTAPRFLATLGPAAGDGPGKVRIPLAVTGTWVRGSNKLSITRDDLESIVRNFRERQNGEINVDYDHASEMPEVAAGGPIPSAGRIVGIDEPETLGANSESRMANGNDDSPLAARYSRFILWGWFEPTERARTLVRDREYRYISPAIDWGAKNKRTGKPQGATLTSVALTNRPFLEEMPQIRLSDPGYRLVGEDHEQGARSQEQGASGERFEVSDSRFETGGSMKKVQLSVADGKIKVNHPDLADEYYADPEDAAQALETLGAQQGGIEAAPGGAARDVPMAQAAAVMSEAEAQGKSISAVEVFRARVEQALDDAVRSGKVLPRRRDDWRRIALADFGAFSRLVSEQPARIPLQPVGFSGGVPENVQAQVKFMAEQRMKERGVSYGQALTEIGREQPDLIHQYRRSVSGGE
ncbi:MAG TPA: phage protease [Terriglobia bacterium]|nr:phage protease [Terriglobia bacterium]